MQEYPLITEARPQKTQETNNASADLKSNVSSSLDALDSQGRACISAKPARLISKKRVSADILDKKSIPALCSYAEIINGETDFGRGKFRTVSYYTESGKLLKTETVKILNGELAEKKTSSYTQEGGADFVRTEIMRPGEPLQVRKEARYVRTDKTGGKSLSRMKLDIQNSNDGMSRHETQIYEDLFPDKEKVVHIKTSADRLNNGEIASWSIDGGISPFQSEAQSDPYFFIRHYDIDDFAYSAALNAQTAQNVSNSGSFAVEHLKGDIKGVYRHKHSIDAAADTRKMQHKSDAVRTINHEYRHKFQHELVDRLSANLELTDEERELALRFLDAMLVYPHPVNDENFEEYYYNLQETDARAAGETEEKKFIDSAQKLSDILKVPAAMFLSEPNPDAAQSGNPDAPEDAVFIDKKTMKTLKSLAEKIKQDETIESKLDRFIQAAIKEGIKRPQYKISLSELIRAAEMENSREILLQPAVNRKRRLIEIID